MALLTNGGCCFLLGGRVGMEWLCGRCGLGLCVTFLPGYLAGDFGASKAGSSTPTYFTLFPPALYYRVFRLEIVSKWVVKCIIRRKTGCQKTVANAMGPKDFLNGLELMYPMPAQLSFPSLAQNKYTRTPGKHKKDDFCYLNQNSSKFYDPNSGTRLICGKNAVFSFYSLGQTLN